MFVQVMDHAKQQILVNVQPTGLEDPVNLPHALE